MSTAAPANRYKNHRFPTEIISHAVWLYFRFCLSFRDVEELLFERGVVVTYEAIRKWCRKFGQHYATQLRRRRPGPATNGTSMRCFSRSRASVTICGARSAPPPAVPTQRSASEWCEARLANEKIQ